ncbi:MAG: hypothetical protein U5Q44_16160 [Dehalococcoidia bacterium]|nr:hypothetical protein [Dehalococcoidia bacterium]
MGFRDLDPAETEHVLDRERVVRLAFHADGEHYLVPVFFTWHEGALSGFTTPGRKTGTGYPVSRASPSRWIAP